MGAQSPQICPRIEKLKSVPLLHTKIARGNGGPGTVPKKGIGSSFTEVRVFPLSAFTRCYVDQKVCTIEPASERAARDDGA